MLTYQKTDIPISKLISYRKKAGRSQQKQGKNNYLTPSWIKEYFKDQDFRYFHSLDEFLFQEPILKINGNGAEFASRTLISPQYVDILTNLAKTAAAKRKRLQNYNERIERSEVSRIRTADTALGNTANNLEKFEKQTREKRYRIQNFIQKNRLPGKRSCDCGAGYEKVYDCEKCRKPGNRVCTCGQPIDEYVTLNKNLEHESISTGGTATCGSVWACPVCRSKIVDQRSKELKEIYTKGKAKGYYFYLVTFTIPHSGNDNLGALHGSSSLGKGLSGAFTKWRSSYIYSKKFKKSAGLIGDIKALEVTWGMINGFHPHLHFVMITENKIDPIIWQKKFLKQWQKDCQKVGLGIPNEKGVKIDSCNDSAQVEYLSKWSVGAELQSDSAKKAKGINYSIAELEYMLIDEYKRSSGMYPLPLERISGILSGYYKAMHGQKQLQYGNLQTGWKKELLEAEEKEDQELAADQESEKTHAQIVVLGKKTYKQLKKSGDLSELIESLEYLEQVPGYTEIAFNKAKNVLYQMGYKEAEIYHPGETLIN